MIVRLINTICAGIKHIEKIFQLTNKEPARAGLVIRH